ncbi:MAG: DNA-formamidopyrimidine glycosylase family protein [Chthoniobacteraceae bacterium]
MPELAEVEYYRKQWDCGLRRKVERVALHGEKRIFRGVNVERLAVQMRGAMLLESEARAKQMLFRFSRGQWLGVHLGMTGRLRVEPPDFSPQKHDHLVLFQRKHALVFNDARQFGRVLFHEGNEPPPWWTKLPPAVTSPEFTVGLVRAFFRRRARLAVKAALLQQERFPGVGNWMADEILWRAKLDPRKLCGQLTAPRIKSVWHETREVCATALATVGVDFSDPPEGWFFHARWTKAGRCPRCQSPLQTATVGGRTTRWCPRCQR